MLNLKKDGTATVYSLAQTAEFAQEISVGADGTVWIVSFDTKPPYPGNVIRYLSDPANRVWTAVSQNVLGSQVGDAPDGSVWLVNADNEVINQPKNGQAASFSPVDFAAAISVGADNTVWVVTTQAQENQPGSVIKWLSNPSAKTWSAIPAPAAAEIVAGGAS